MTVKGCNQSAKSPKKMLLSSVIGVAARIVLLTAPVLAIPLIATAKSNIFTGNFESGDLSGWQKELCCKKSAQVVSSPTRDGNKAVKFTLTKGDPYVANKPRAELRLKPVTPNSEHWYGYSVFVPKDYTKERSFEIVTQWHNPPDTDLGENWRRPGLSLQIKNDNYVLENHWDSKPVTKIWKEASQEWELGEVAKGEWTDWVFHIKWSYKSDGLIEVWKNGQLLVRKNGPNTYNDEKGPFMKIGIYKPEWKSNPDRSTATQRVLYFDEVRVGDADASFTDVEPRTTTSK